MLSAAITNVLYFTILNFTILTKVYYSNYTLLYYTALCLKHSNLGPIEMSIGSIAFNRHTDVIPDPRLFAKSQLNAFKFLI